MILILAESSLELIPRELWSHPSVVADSKKRKKQPGEIILDRARHHHAMKNLQEAAKRGRPDIVHQSLLFFQYSLLNKKGLGRVYIHTYGDYVIEVDPTTRIPKNYINFIGLFEQLFKEGAVPRGRPPLLKIKKLDLRSLLKELGDIWLVLHESGERKSLWDLGRALINSVVVVGGFPHGDFKNKWLLEKAGGVYKIGDESLDTAQVVCRAVAAAEAAAGLT
ncbi:MAG: 16S rRNA methyltransferase [Pyrobaculum sp.]